MSHGQPDYGMYTLAKTIYRLSDMGELAARLGSIDTFDRRGDIVFLGDFESGKGSWQFVLGGVGPAIDISAEQARSGFLSCKMTGGTAGSAKLQRELPLPVNSGVGLEFSMSWDKTVTTEYILAVMQSYDGTNSRRFELKYTVNATVISIRKEDGAYVELPLTKTLEPVPELFHTFKMVGDYSTNKWKRLIVNHEVFDLSAYGLYSLASGSDPELIIQIWWVQATGATHNAYIDNVIVTQNEY